MTDPAGPAIDEHESSAVAEVLTRLSQRFPNVDADVIEAAVRLEHAQLDGPIRDFVPILVEHAARDRIAVFADRDHGPGLVPHDQ